MICSNLNGPRVVCDVCQVADAGPQRLAEKLRAAEIAAQRARHEAIRAIDRVQEHKKISGELLARGMPADVPGLEALEVFFKTSSETWHKAEQDLAELRKLAAAVPGEERAMLSYFAEQEGFSESQHPDHPERLRHVCASCRHLGLLEEE